MKSWTPIVTPNLAKKIIEVRLVGANLDDLDESVNRFSVVFVESCPTSSDANGSELR